MTAILLPDIDLDALRKAIPNLGEIDLPSMEQAGKKADETLDRILGRSSMPVWPWLAVGAVIIAIIGSIAAVLTLNRRSTYEPLGEPISTNASAGITATDDMLG